MEFMGISVGILALICALAILFGVRGTRKILGWLVLLAVLGIGGTLGFVAWQDQKQHQTASKPTEWKIIGQGADGSGDPLVMIDGVVVQIDKKFLSLSPAEQSATIQKVAADIRTGERNGTTDRR